MTTTLSTLDDLRADWRKRDRAHAQDVVDATATALNHTYSVVVAERITVVGGPGQDGPSMEGPWVRVFEESGEGRLVWTRGRTVVPDDKVVAVDYAPTDEWDRVEQVRARRPSEPCGESFVRYEWNPDGDHSQPFYCRTCEKPVPTRREGEDLVVAPHNVAGFVIAAAQHG